MARKSHSTFIIVILLGVSSLCAASGLAILALTVVMNWPDAVKPPTLAGVAPAPVAERVPISRDEPEQGSFGVPAGWYARSVLHSVESQQSSQASIHNWPLPPGVPLATSADRRRAVALEARIEHAKVTEPVEVQVGEQNVIEVAGIDDVAGGDRRDQWTLHVFIFSGRTFSHVRCEAFGIRWSGLFPWERASRDWDDALPGCAAVVASLKVPQ
jgi:hypothetical protein